MGQVVERHPLAMTRVIGLSGGIGSGKSTVTRILDELGATTIDADAIVALVKEAKGSVQAPKSIDVCILATAKSPAHA